MNMLKLLRYALISAFIILGAKVVSAQDGNDLNKFDLAQMSWEYGGDGYINGAGKIYMQVHEENGQMVGEYYYMKTNKNRQNKAWIYLYGSWDGRTMTLYERGNGRKNGYFHGTFSGNGYRGTFYRNDGKKFKFNISLY